MSDDLRDQIDCFFDQRILQSYSDLQQILFTSFITRSTPHSGETKSRIKRNAYFNAEITIRAFKTFSKGTAVVANHNYFSFRRFGLFDIFFNVDDGVSGRGEVWGRERLVAEVIGRVTGKLYFLIIFNFQLSGEMS